MFYWANSGLNNVNENKENDYKPYKLKARPIISRVSQVILVGRPIWYILAMSFLIGLVTKIVLKSARAKSEIFGKFYVLRLFLW